MQITSAIPAVWVYTSQDTYNSYRTSGYAKFLSKPEQARLERMRQATLLFEGKHREYFLNEQRTQFDFPPTLLANKEVNPYIKLNLLKLISMKSADLLFGEEPLLRVEDDIQAAALSALVDRASLHQRFHAAAVSSSARAESFVECSLSPGDGLNDPAVYVRQLPASEMFPIGDIQPNGQYAAYKRLTLAQVGGTALQPIYGLLTTTYTAGAITRTLKQLDDQGEPLMELALGIWPGQAPDAPLDPETKTGLQVNTVTWVANQFDLDETQAVSDYDGLIELQDELNAKQTQIARVLAKHSDPKMAFPEAMFDPEGNIHTGYGAFPFRSKDELPTYITWNAELSAALEDRKFTLNLLLITAETSPVLLGLKEGGAPDAFKKVRLEASNSLSKAQRKAAIWKSAIKRIVTTAMLLEQTIPGTRYDMTPVAAEMRDGIPVDDLEQANTISILRSAGVMSVRRAVTEQLSDAGAVETELQELKDEAAAATPSIFMQPPQPGGQEAGTEPSFTPKAHADMGDNAADDAAAERIDQTEVAA
jgi:hypothetical protein